MKKHLGSLVFCLLFTVICFCQKTSGRLIPDGLYLISKLDTDITKQSVLVENEHAVFFSKLFEEYNSNEFLRIILDTTQYVPLELEKLPVTEQQTEQKKKLLLSLTPDASEKLKVFSSKYVMRHVALVVDGEALTMHKIKELLSSGQLQITRCGDNACERLFVTLKDNVRK